MTRVLTALAAGLTLVAPTAVAVGSDAATPRPAYALDNGLARTPPMGFNDWNAFGCNVDQQLITQTADFFVSSGLKDAGYQYVNIDDCWMTHQRDAEGRLVADPVKFPDGIAWLADYVHARGLKLGIYSSAGTLTCAGFPASLDREEIDAQTFAAWGIDYLKYDNCNNQGVDAITRYTRMRDALAATGRPIVYSVVEWGQNDPWTWAPEVGNLWRTTGDITDNFGSVRSIIRQNMDLHQFAAPGAWNDPDMLEVGNGRMTDIEYRTHFGMWAMLAAPLLIGTDLRRATPATMEILLNREVIAIDQDRLGVQARPVSNDAGRMVFARPLTGGDVAVALYNETDLPADIATTATAAGLGPARGYALRDVWQHTTVDSAGQIRAFVPPHGTVVYRVSPADRSSGLAPATSVSISAPEGAAGTLFWLVRPGAESILSTTLTNLGRQDARTVSVALTAPAGWQVTPLSAPAARVVHSDRSLTTRWRVRPAAGAVAGGYELTGTGLFSWGRDNWSQTVGRAPVLVAVAPAAGAHALSDVSWITADSFWGPVEVDRSNGEQPAGDGQPITIGGATYAKGLGTHANSEVVYFLGGACTALRTDIGIDDEKTAAGDATWQIWTDATLAAEATATWQDGPKQLTADLTGAQVLRLVTADNGDPNSDHTDWADPRLECAAAG